MTMVGLWSPEPPSDRSNENLSAQNPLFMPVVQTSDEEEGDDVIGYEGYEPISDAETSIPDSPGSDSEDEATETASTANETCTVGSEPCQSEACLNLDPGQLISELWSSASNLASTIEMGEQQAAEVLAAMANFTLPPSAVPEWAASVPEEQWRQRLMDRIQSLQKSSSQADSVVNRPP